MVENRSEILASTRGNPTLRGYSTAQLVGLVFVVVLSVKLAFIAVYANSVPFWDQWDAEAAQLYRPYRLGTLTVADLFLAHNEHRIFFTRVLNLLLFEAAGGWNPLLQMSVNALLHTCLAGILVALLLPAIRSSERLLLAGFSAFIFAVPVGWENLLAGFQSQFYFLLLFSLLSLSLFVVSRAFSVRWWAGYLFCICAYFSLASGLLAACAAIAIAVVQLLAGARRRDLREGLALAVLTGTVAIMMAFTVEVPGHAVLKAHSVASFLAAFVSAISTPVSFVGWILHIPLLLLAFRTIKSTDQAAPADWTALAVAGWVGMQIVSLSYGRASGVEASRYQDIYILLLPLDLFALLRVTGPSDGGKRAGLWKYSWVSATAAAVVVFALAPAIIQMQEKRRLSRLQAASIIEFLETGDARALEGKGPFEIPYPDPKKLAAWLRDPDIRAILPAEFR